MSSESAATVQFSFPDTQGALTGRGVPMETAHTGDTRLSWRQHIQETRDCHGDSTYKRHATVYAY